MEVKQHPKLAIEAKEQLISCYYVQLGTVEPVLTKYAMKIINCMKEGEVKMNLIKFHHNCKTLERGLN